MHKPLEPVGIIRDSVDGKQKYCRIQIQPARKPVRFQDFAQILIDASNAGKDTTELARAASAVVLAGPESKSGVTDEMRLVASQTLTVCDILDFLGLGIVDGRDDDEQTDVSRET